MSSSVCQANKQERMKHYVMVTMNNPLSNLFFVNIAFLLIFSSFCQIRPFLTQARLCHDELISTRLTVSDVRQRTTAFFNSATSSIDLSLQVSWNVSVPKGVRLDGFIYKMTEENTILMQATNVCNPGSDYFWVNTNNSRCTRNSDSLCTTSNFSGSSETPRLCPIDFFSDGRTPSCTGTGTTFVKYLEFTSIPWSVRELTFDIKFHTSYSLLFHAYSDQFVSQVQNLNGAAPGTLQIHPIVDCPGILSRSMSISIVEATQLCCDQNIDHFIARNITLGETFMDLDAQAVNASVSWLPPIDTADIVDNGKVYIFGSGRQATIPVVSVLIRKVSLSVEEKERLSSCDNATHYYTTEIQNLKPTVEYTIVVETEYKNAANGKNKQKCDEGRCVADTTVRIPDLNVCDRTNHYCVSNANCTAEDITGATTFNATCSCQEGFFGNGINRSTYSLGTDCSDLSYCSPGLNPCNQHAICIDRAAPLLGADCECSTLYFGDGKSCTSLLAVILGVTLPAIAFIALLIGFIGRRYYQIREKRNDLQWSQFVANDALKTYTMINNLAFSNDEDICMPTFGDKWEIDRNKLQLGLLLGRGNYGVVYQALYEMETDEGCLIDVPVAVKTLKEGTDEERHIAEFLAEIGFMLNVGDHPNVLNVIGCCTTQKPVYLITDYLKYGDLLHFLWDAREPTKCLEDLVYHLTEKSLYQMARQVAEGMDYLTKSRIIHGDIAARNILVGENLTCKISDFGLANDVYRYGVIQGQSERCVPLKWISPERMMAGKVPITSKSDVWSFGILLYEMVTLGCMPHADVPTEGLLEELKSGYRMRKPSTCSIEMYSLMSKCWKWRPSSRPSFATLISLIDGGTAGLVKDKNYINLIDTVQELNKLSYEDEMEIAKKKHASEHQTLIIEESLEKQQEFKDINSVSLVVANDSYSNIVFDNFVVHI